MPEIFAREYVAQVNFDERHRNGEERVAQRDAGVREGARIDDHESRPIAAASTEPCAMSSCSALLWAAIELMTARPGQRCELGLDIGQR